MVLTWMFECGRTYCLLDTGLRYTLVLLRKDLKRLRQEKGLRPNGMRLPWRDWKRPMWTNSLV